MTRSPAKFILPAVGALSAVALLGDGAAAQSGPVSAYPVPGTPTASPGTQISFRGRSAGELGEIVVRGSRSGTHPGTLRPHSDGRGASFVPARPFRANERVSVETSLEVHGARDGDFTFRTARIPGNVQIRRVLLEPGVRPGKRHRFRTRPNLRPPVITVDPRRRAPAGAGHVILSPKAKDDSVPAGPLIADTRGRPLYFHPLAGIAAATDARVQTYKGRPVLTYWQGTSRQGIGKGELIVRDQSYRIIRRLRAPNGLQPDLHEFLITPRDTALLISYPSVKADLSSVGGLRNGTAIDSVIQEVDLDTGLVIFEWHSIGQIPISETISRPAVNSPRVPFDYAHANSVGLDDDGDIIVSMRNTWAVYKIDRETGQIVWRLGGKRSTFKLGRGVKFAWQHDARRRADGAITVFDNSAFPPVRKRSRAIAVRLDEAAKTATLTSAAIHPRRLLSATQGNAQTLEGGGMLVGWGSQRYLTEYAADGRVLWDARVAVGFESYRAYRSPWVGRPTTRPAALGLRRGAAMDVYASWNGATEVATWEVLAGASSDALTPVASGRRIGFETRVRVPRRTAWFAVRAKDASGAVLGESTPRRVRG